MGGEASDVMMGFESLLVATVASRNGGTHMNLFLVHGEAGRKQSMFAMAHLGQGATLADSAADSKCSS